MYVGLKDLETLDLETSEFRFLISALRPLTSDL